MTPEAEVAALADALHRHYCPRHAGSVVPHTALMSEGYWPCRADARAILAALAVDGLVVTTREQAAVGEAVERLGDEYTIHSSAAKVVTTVYTVEYRIVRHGEADTLPDAIAAALGEQS